MRSRTKKCLVTVTALCTITASLAFPSGMSKAAYGDSGAAAIQLADSLTADNGNEAAVFTFSDTEVTAEGLESGYKIEGTAVTVSEAGTYVFSGKCADGSITVKKGTTGVKLVLDGLDLTSASALSGPILCKASTETEIVANVGTVNKLTDSAANAEEKAAIKVNKQSALLLSGTGTLQVNGVYKNGIKGGAQTDITVREQNLQITAADNGLASDNTVTVKSGTLSVTAGGDGIKSSPDRVDEEGNPDDTVSLGDVILEGGEVNITAMADGIQGDNSVTINGGTYQIKTNGGYTTTLAEDADSCKGIKSDSNLTINGGEFEIDSADDALHSNEYISVLGGNFDIRTGDDGMHADTSLIVGSEEGESDVDISIRNCYEGLEAGTVYVNGGNVNINSTDDGINAAGGNDGSGNNGRPGDGFNPGGGRPGSMGGGPGGRTAAGSTYAVSAEDNTYAAAQTGSSDYAIHINGGVIYVKAAGDGLDSNGDLYISGGNIIVYGAAAGGPGSDNFPFDHDRTFAISGGYIFGAGSSQMEEGVQSSTQGYIVDRSTYNQGTVIHVTDNQGNVLFTETLAERVNYMMYSSPQMAEAGNYSFKTGQEAEQIDISQSQVTLAQDIYTYNGMAKRPDVTVTYGGKTLVKNTDYTVAYSNNINVGTAKVTIAGMGRYTGTLEKSFEILEQSEEGSDSGGSNSGGNTSPDNGTNPDNNTNPGGSTNPDNGKNPGGSTNAGGTIDAGEANNQKPSQVTGVSAVPVNSSKIKISWEKMTAADGYFLYRYDSSKKAWNCIKEISKSTVTSYVDSRLASGTAYKYQVCAYIADKGEKKSGILSKAVTVATKPAKCVIKKASAKNKSIVLNWKKKAGSGYEITYSTKKNFSGAKTIKVKGARKSSYTIKKLKAGKTYYVKIRAYKKAGNKIYRGAYSARKAVKVK